MNARFYQALLESTSPLVVAVGPAGTGKTYLPSKLAAAKLRSGALQKLILTRPAVTVGENHGFLPGNVEKKMQPWTQPVMDHMHEKSRIEVCPLAFMRGRTFHNAWIIADEMQNSTPAQMKMALTRIGHGSKMIVTGDLSQIDVPESGLADLLMRMDRKYLVEFDDNDVQRSEIIREILSWYHR